MSKSTTIDPKLGRLLSKLSPYDTIGTGETRKFICKFPECGKTFSTSGHLTRHHRIHTGLRNHSCLVPGCESLFSRHDNMMQHYRTHIRKLKDAGKPVPVECLPAPKKKRKIAKRKRRGGQRSLHRLKEDEDDEDEDLGEDDFDDNDEGQSQQSGFSDNNLKRINSAPIEILSCWTQVPIEMEQYAIEDYDDLFTGAALLTAAAMAAEPYSYTASSRSNNSPTPSGSDDGSIDEKTSGR